jgi:hypothetical protein
VSDNDYRAGAQEILASLAAALSGRDPKESVKHFGRASRRNVKQVVSRAAATILIAGGVAGCTGIGEENWDNALAEPGKYTLYSCRDMETSISNTTARLTELEQLISRASQGPGGALMSAVAYQTEYRQSRAQLRALKLTAAEKQCVVNSDYLSRRSVY